MVLLEITRELIHTSSKCRGSSAVKLVRNFLNLKMDLEKLNRNDLIVYLDWIDANLYKYYS